MFNLNKQFAFHKFLFIYVNLFPINELIQLFFFHFYIQIL